MNPWILLSILLGCVCIGLIVRLLVEDHATHEAGQRILRLERENAQLRDMLTGD